MAPLVWPRAGVWSWVVTGSETVWFCPLPSHHLSQMGGGTHRSLVNTGGLNCPWALTHVQSRDMSAHLTAGIRHSPGRPALCQGVCVWGWWQLFCVSGETEAWFLEGDPWKNQAVLRVSGEEALVCRGQGKLDGFGGGVAVIFPRFRVGSAFMLCLPAAHLCGFPGLWRPWHAPHIWAQLPGCIPKPERLHCSFWGDSPELLSIYIFILFLILPDFLVGTTMKNNILENLVYARISAQQLIYIVSNLIFI